MGTDKGLLEFRGKKLFSFILDQVQGVSDDVYIISNREDDDIYVPYRVFPDKILDIGALGGIYSALSYAQNALCLILACDMPFVNRALIELLRTEAAGFDAVIPELRDGMLEPFRAIYRTTCLPAVKAAIDAGERRAVSFLPQVKAKRIPPAALAQIDPNLESFVNINTPEDLAQIEARANSDR
jgi:molybdopterin-guanine dinucleotide biosynthesis protein A